MWQKIFPRRGHSKNFLDLFEKRPNNTAQGFRSILQEEVTGNAEGSLFEVLCVRVQPWHADADDSAYFLVEEAFQPRLLFSPPIRSI